MILPLQTITAVLLTGVASFLWWGSLRSPWLFVTIGMLAMLGLAKLFTVLWTYGRIVFSPVSFLERQPTASADQLMRSWASFESLAISLLVLTVGMGLLFWLRRSLGAA